MQNRRYRRHCFENHSNYEQYDISESVRIVQRSLVAHFTFAFIHLADDFIQRDSQTRKYKQSDVSSGDDEDL